MRRGVHQRASGSVCASLWLAAALARAEPPPGTPIGSGPAAPDEQSELLLERAKSLFREGDYRQALPLVERAYALTESPRFLFNLGVLHHKLSQCVPARDYFELYLQRDPAGAARPQTLAALQELRPRCPESAPASAPAVAPAESRGTVPSAATAAPAGPLLPPLPPLADPPERTWAPGASALLLLGAGAAAGVGAMISLAAQGTAEGDIDALGRRAATDGGTWDTFEAERRELASSARLYRGLSIGLGAACVALVGAGATVWIVELDSGSSLGPSGASVGYQGRF